MKHFLTILLGVIPFFAPCQSVTIPAEAARYFLERDDLARVLAEKDSLNKQIISNLELKITGQSSIIQTYKNDSVTYKNVIANKDIELNLTESEKKILKKEIRKQKFLKVVGFVAFGVVVIASL